MDFSGAAHTLGGSLRLSSLISTELLETTLNGMLNSMTKQAQDIAALKEMIVDMVPRSEVAAAHQRYSARVEQLEAMVARLSRELETAAAASVVGSAPPEGSLASRLAALSVSVGEHTSKLSLCATRAEVDAGFELAHEKMLARAPAALGLPQLSQSLSQVVEQAAMLQGLLSTKVDRAEWSRIAACAADMSLQSAACAAAVTRVEDVACIAREATAGVDRTLDSIGQLSAVCQALAEAVGVKADSTDTDALRSQLSALARDVDRFHTADASSTGALSAAVARLEALVAAASANAARALERDSRAAAATATALSALQQRVTATEQAQRLASSLASAAASSSTAAPTSAAPTGSGIRPGGSASAAEPPGVSSDEFVAVVADLRAEVDARAYLSALEATDEAVAGLARDLRSVSKKAEVALKFVDW